MNIICTICDEELKELGGLLFSPPSRDTIRSNTGQDVLKYHLCKLCYEEVFELMLKLISKKSG